MSDIHKQADVVHHILQIQKAASALGLTVEFKERRPDIPIGGTSPVLACVLIDEVRTGDEHVFFSFVEARAFLRGLAVAKTFHKEA